MRFSISRDALMRDLQALFDAKPASQGGLGVAGAAARADLDHHARVVQ